MAEPEKKPELAIPFEVAMQYPIGDLIRGYRNWETSVRDYERAVASILELPRAQMEAFKQAIKQKLLDAKQNSANTAAGTAYLSETETATVENWEDFHAFVEEMQDRDFLIKGCASTKAIEYRDLHGSLPPGIKSTKVLKVGIRG